jgi:hypothetical protein
MKLLSLLAVAVTLQAQILTPIAFRSTVAASGPTLVSSFCQSAATIDGWTTNSFNSTGGNFIVFSVTKIIGGSITVSDNKSNGNATLLTAQSGSNSTAAQIGYWQNPTTGTSHTITISGTGIYTAICVEVWSGMNTSSVYDGTVQGGSGVSTTCAPGSLTPSSGAKVVVTGLTTGSVAAGTVSIDAGFTSENVLGDGGNGQGAALAYLTQVSGTATNPTWTVPSSSFPGCTIAAFKGA